MSRGVHDIVRLTSYGAARPPRTQGQPAADQGWERSLEEAKERTRSARLSDWGSSTSLGNASGSFWFCQPHRQGTKSLCERLQSQI